jgi:hypothetical protein
MTSGNNHIKTGISRRIIGACILMAVQTPSDSQKKYAIKAIAEWLSRSTEEELGLMDVVVLEELMEQARDSEETPQE